MTQISRLPLPKMLENEMFMLFHKALADLHTEKDVAEFLEDLLTPTERVMLGKRLAIAILLDKGYDQRTIHQIMKVSVSTVSSVNFWLKQKGNGYRKVMAKLKSREEWKKVKADLEETLAEIFSVRRQRKQLWHSTPDKEVIPRDTIL